MSSILDTEVFGRITTASRHLYGPKTDGLLLGGASIFAFILVRIIDISSTQATALAFLMLFLANFINHPHFVHSYQIFYSLRSTLRDPEVPLNYRRRWLAAAYWIPAFLFVFIAWATIQWTRGDGRWLAALINVMGALVGWHYVKQGFGMAMLDASIKRCFWPALTRRALLVNAYACWIAAWALANTGTIGASFWGVFQLRISVPVPLIVFLCLLAAGTTIWCLLRVANSIAEWRASGMMWIEMPLNGGIAYLVTLYLWTLFAWVDPAYVLLIPFFHSLQYLTVAWRYKINEINGGFSSCRNKLIKFGATGLLLGVIGFWVVPGGIDYFFTGRIPFKSQGVFVGIACAWLFVNIHHYFIDSVIWRKENPLTRKYLF